MLSAKEKEGKTRERVRDREEGTNTRSGESR